MRETKSTCPYCGVGCGYVKRRSLYASTMIETKSTCPYCGVGCGLARARTALRLHETPQPLRFNHG